MTGELLLPSTNLRFAAILLIDVVGFTAMADEAVRRGIVGAEKLAETINQWLGDIFQTIGAAVGISMSWPATRSSRCGSPATDSGRRMRWRPHSRPVFRSRPQEQSASCPFVGVLRRHPVLRAGWVRG